MAVKVKGLKSKDHPSNVSSMAQTRYPWICTHISVYIHIYIIIYIKYILYIYTWYIYNYIYICIYHICYIYIWYIYMLSFGAMERMTMDENHPIPKIWPGTATEVELQIGLKDYDTQRDKRFAGAGGADLWTGFDSSAVEKASNLGWFHSGFDEDSELPYVSLNSNSFWTELVYVNLGEASVSWCTCITLW